ncbi:mannonate dehydratase [Pedobacter sp. BAL39]|uniref:mannonate dehydratase n=1 Tax=Pedobacter sp. BAL39 TaxID=391596 RepID=UPI000155A8F6|nr:mannonate dehydratase [Pedobacter sp. BAL39]EDM34859.1 mannonate dehydratase [Pedobacter sp. BAL39]
MNRNQKLIQTWRWYGPSDPVTLEDVRQAGAKGIVTALHHVPHGEVWSVEDIIARKNIIEAAGLTWSVVESVPVHESIKTRAADADVYIANYISTLRNLSSCGVRTVCYNFMPVLDWTRTQLDKMMDDGSKALYFNWIDLAIFDLYILKRTDAGRDYDESIKIQAVRRYESMTVDELRLLKTNVLMGIPNEQEIELEVLQHSIDVYSEIGTEGLRQNLLYFLSQIRETCEQEEIKMTIHPDDPPYPILGLPRIASTKADLEWILNGVDSAFNGICFCTGSLGAGKTNNLSEIFESVKSRVYFLHLRNVIKDAEGSFYEADHLEGDVDMYGIMKAVVKENGLRATPIPFRPDHGHQMLDDLHKVTNPGYSAIGRLRGLAELRGLELGLSGSGASD